MCHIHAYKTMNFNTIASQESLEKASAALAANGFSPTFVASKEEALAKVRELIPEGVSIMNGASDLMVDAGAAAALGRGSSLLAAGVTLVEGEFQRGDAVAVRAADGVVLAHGLAEYDAAECRKLAGHRNADHADLLGYAPRSAVVHRDQMVVL